LTIGSAKYVSEITNIALKIMAFPNIGHCPMKGLRIYRDAELIANATKKITIVIFHLGGGD
jgi:hypothetical protein